MANTQHERDAYEDWVQKPRRFGVADLTQGFYEISSHENSRAPTVFVCFQGVYDTGAYGTPTICDFFPEEYELLRVP